MRTSLSVTMAKKQIRMLFILGIPLLLVLAFSGILLTAKAYEEQAEAAIVSVETGRMLPADAFTRNSGITYKMTDKASGEILYNNRQYGNHPLFGIFQGIQISFSKDEPNLVVVSKYTLLQENRECQVSAYVDLSESIQSLIYFLITMTLTYMFILAWYYVYIKSTTKDVLSPLQRMSAILERLSFNNLHSERLDIMDTNNELRDLAIVCNEMLDRLETAYESQKQFVSNASHELRTPIAVMQGYANMLSRWGSSDPAILSEAVDALCNVSKEMQELVEKLLFLSRHDRRTLKLKKDWFNMKDVVDETFRETEMVVHDRVLQCTADEKVMVYGDKQILKQAIRVFIDNAVKYTEKGDAISISCKNVRNECEIIIEDTGIGMKRKDLDRIFSRFYRADDVRDRNIGGHGLGLSIAKLIIMSHSGRIHIRTQYTKGTSFTIYIPHRR